MYNPRLLHISSYEEAKKEISRVNVEKVSIPMMSPKAIHITIKIENLPSYGANIIKQEMLSKGGEAAVSKNAVNCREESSDAIIMGTLKQISLLVDKLKMQPKSLRILGNELERILRGIKGQKPKQFITNKHTLPLGHKTYIMGILNLTPDSFSDGGSFNDVDSAIKRALEMIDEGADIIDIGGESTRPGHDSISPEMELSRVLPVIDALSKIVEIPISIDTTKVLVAEKSVLAGVNIINDIWGLQKDPGIAQIAAAHKTGLIVMHNNSANEYHNIIGHITQFLDRSVEIAKENGINDESILLDPGIGFGKTSEGNLEVLNRLDELRILNYPLLLGTSRKSMIGNVLDLSVNDRLEGSLATGVLGITKGIDFLRVHDVKETVKTARMTDAIVRRNNG